MKVMCSLKLLLETMTRLVIILGLLSAISAAILSKRQLPADRHLSNPLEKHEQRASELTNDEGEVVSRRLLIDDLEGICNNKIGNCHLYGQPVCTSFRKWAAENCAKYCGFCPGETCIYRGVMYHQGEKWDDGCKYNCTCEDAETGTYRCLQKCPVYPNVSGNLCQFLNPEPGKCCKRVICPFPTSSTTD